MPYVAMVYNPAAPHADSPAADGPARRMHARYLAGLYELDELGLQLRRQAAQVGMEGAQVWVGLSDGGNGLEEFLRQNFNRADLVLILDFWHPTGYLEKLAKAVHAKDAEAAVALTQRWCSLLKAQGGAVTLATLRAWDLPLRRPFFS